MSSLSRKVKRNRIRNTDKDKFRKSELIENYNAKLYIEADDNPDVNYRRVLHPTKGYRKISKTRDLIIDTPKLLRYKKVLNTLQRCQVKS